MKLTNGYQCGDGTWFKKEDHKQAKKHQAWLELVTLCDLLCAGYGVVDSDSLLPMAIVDNSTELQRLLRAGPVEGGGETPVDEEPST